MISLWETIMHVIYFVIKYKVIKQRDMSVTYIYNRDQRKYYKKRLLMLKNWLMRKMMFYRYNS